MNRKLGVSCLIFCFALSNLQAAGATQIVDAPPVVVQPYEVQQLNQEMVDRDRKNRDEEIEIQNIIQENNKLIQSTLSQEEDESLKKINEVMENYHKAIYARDQARIMANSQPGGARYGDLVALTEKADEMTDLLNKSGLLTEKYQMLTALKDEMTALNDKLRNQENDALSQRETVIHRYQTIAEDQLAKIKMLVDRLSTTDQKISHYDEIMASKEAQISQLKDSLSQIQGQNTNQDNLINKLQQEIIILKTQIQDQISNLNTKDQTIKEQQEQIALLQGQGKVETSSSSTLPSAAAPTTPAAETPPAQASGSTTFSPAPALTSAPPAAAAPSAETTAAPAPAQGSTAFSLAPTSAVAPAGAAPSAQTAPATVAPTPAETAPAPTASGSTAFSPASTTASNPAAISTTQATAPAEAGVLSSNDEEIIKAKDQTIKSQADRLAEASEQIKEQQEKFNSLQQEIVQFKNESQHQDAGPNNSEATSSQNQGSQYADLQAQIIDLKSRVQYQEAQLKDKQDLIKSQADQISQNAVNQGELEGLKNRLQYQDALIRDKEGLLRSKSDQNAQFADLQSQLADLKSKIQEEDAQLKDKEALLKAQSEQMAQYGHLQDQLADLRKRVEDQVKDLRAKQDTIHWLNQVLAAAKNKAEYYQLTSKEDQLTMRQVQGEVSGIKEDFARHARDYDQFENAIVDLKGQVSRLSLQLAQKQNQVDSLQSQLNYKTSQENEQSRMQETITADLKAKLAQRESQIENMKADIQKIMEDQANDDRLKLARQLIGLQEQEAELLNEKNQVISPHSSAFDQHVLDLQDKIKGLLAAHQSQTSILKDHLAQLKTVLSQKEEEMDSLKSDLDNKIGNANRAALMLEDFKSSQAQYQGELEYRIQMLKTQLDSQENQIERIKTAVDSGQVTASQTEALNQKLIDQQNRVDSLKAELDTKIGEYNRVTLMLHEYKAAQSQKQSAMEYQIQELKSRLLGQENQIGRMKAEIQSGQDTQSQTDQLKGRLARAEDNVDLLKQELENKIKEANQLNLTVEEYKLKDHSRQDTKSEVDALKQEIEDQQNRLEGLTVLLKNKIAQEKDQRVLEDQVRDLKNQLENSEERVSRMQSQIQSGNDSGSQLEVLKQQWADQRAQIDLLKQELNNKIAQVKQTSLLLADYQKKLESRNNDYNQELQQVLASKNYQAQMEKQISDLNSLLQEKEAEIVGVKEQMYELQKRLDAKDKDTSARDLTLSIAQQKEMDAKIKDYQAKIDALNASNITEGKEVLTLKAELSLARQQLKGVPTSDQINYLNAGLKKATLELSRKDALLAQAQARADEYQKEFKAQSGEFLGIKAQLQNALDEIDRRNEDLKYKNLEIKRLKLKGHMSAKEADLEDQIRVLTQKLNAAAPKGVVPVSGPVSNNVSDLQAQLDSANARVIDLQNQLGQLKSLPNDRLHEKLKQALDEVDAQGRVINLLVQKLHDTGISVNLSDYFSKS